MPRIILQTLSLVSLSLVPDVMKRKSWCDTRNQSHYSTLRVEGFDICCRHRGPHWSSLRLTPHHYEVELLFWTTPRCERALTFLLNLQNSEPILSQPKCENTQDCCVLVASTPLHPCHLSVFYSFSFFPCPHLFSPIHLSPPNLFNQYILGLSVA